MKSLLANKHIRSLAIALGGALGAALTSWAASTDLGVWGPLVGAVIAWLINAVKVWWTSLPTAAIVLMCCATSYAAPRATIDGPVDKSITLTIAVSGSEPVTITLPSVGTSPLVPTPIPPVVPVVPVVPTPDTFGLRLKTYTLAKRINDPDGAKSIADSALGIAAKIRAVKVTPQEASDSLAGLMKSQHERWKPLTVMLGGTKAKLHLDGELALLIALGKLSDTDVATWATLLEEIAAALREAAK